MALDAGFLSLLTASVVHEARLSKDQWGNTQYEDGSPEKAFIDSTNTGYGRQTPQSFKESQATATATVYLDADVGVDIGDRVTYDATAHYVTDLVTFKDEFGENLLQVVTVSDQKKG